MQWTVPYIIYRIADNGELVEIFHAADPKMAKYWLSYIAQQADVLCRTPLHPKHSRETDRPEYWCHKGEDENPRYCEDEWLVLAEKLKFSGYYPQEQLTQASSSTTSVREEKKCLY